MSDQPQPLISTTRPSLRGQIIPQAGAWFFGLGLIVFIAAVVASGGLYFYRQSLENNRGQWQARVEAQEKELGSVTDLIDYSNAVVAAKDLLAQHTFASNALLFLQDMTHSLVRFNNFALQVDPHTISLAGAAASYQTVADQIRLFESRADAVEKVDFSGLSADDKGQVSFSMVVTFKSSLLQLRSSPEAPAEE